MPSPSIGRATGPSKFQPKLNARIQTRCGRLGLKEGAYFSILIHNDLILGTPLKLRSGRARSEEEKREPLSMSIPVDLKQKGVARATAAGGTFTAYLEHLANEDLARGGPLVILLRKNG